tara:strand:- start:127 stop:852 length:726 start_codon:yes stop_codon:yes gene_type:complete
MNSIILAAGRGSRIPEISKKKPKCLIDINGSSILSRQISFLKKSNIKNIFIIRGYKKKYIKFKSIQYIENKNYKKNEQLSSLYCARKHLKGNSIILFSDIIYDYKILKKILNSKNGDIILGVDRNWKKRYKFRYDHPFAQADKVSLTQKNEITKIGKKLNLNKTNAEFLGILKLSKNGCEIFKKNFKFFTKKKMSKMQIHDFLNFLIKKKVSIKSCSVRGKYMEIDTYNDYKLAQKMFPRK